MLLPDVMILISRSMQSGAARNIGRSPMPNAAKHFINVERRASKCSIRLSCRFSIGYFSSFFFSSSAALAMSFFSSCASFCSMSRAFCIHAVLCRGLWRVREFFCRQKESEQRLESIRFRINLKTLFSPYKIFCVSTGITVMAFTGQAFWHAPQPMQPLASICGKPPFFRQII